MNSYNDDIREIFESMIVFLLIVELSKIPEYICEYCGRSYKQELRYITHIENVHCDTKSIAKVHSSCSSSIISSDEVKGRGDESNENIRMDELIKQNREMLDIIKQQQEAIMALLRHNNIL
jgi:hypothetical protein